ncbi:ABC transporter permease [Trujillonella endophytica]|uniref:Simple sugar transport system permease protein n=1 Tax=Trujillonella endophytica TaxID=673521 RepID=A0A1H8RRK4_9ACTN|nr:ABC transporter permease [Trujillella endophytica]SEO69249.1 simple sugar transport system permease protein [Trujillella endophytica]
MTAVQLTKGAGTPPPRSAMAELFLGGGPARRAAWMALGLMLLFSLARVISGEERLTAAPTISLALGLAVPIGLAALGGLFSERAGVVNIGLEGMMILGTWGAGWAGYQWGWQGALVGGLVLGAVGGLLHAVTTVTFGVDHVVSGVAINILAAGVVRFLSELLYDEDTGGGPAQSPPMKGDAPEFTVPLLSEGLRHVEERHWFLVSDAAGVLGGLVTDISWFTVGVVLLIPLSFFLLWRTSFGLRLRSCGENPTAADSLGVPVYRFKYIAVVISGALAGLGGVALVYYADIYREGQTDGRGFIGLAALIFGNWRPGGLAAGAGLFGYSDALSVRSETAVVALLLVLAFLLLGVAVYQAIRRQLVRAGVALVFAAIAVTGYLTIEEPDGSLLSFTPHLITLLVLSLASQRLQMPKADGLVWRRGEN